MGVTKKTGIFKGSKDRRFIEYFELEVTFKIR